MLVHKDIIIRIIFSFIFFAITFRVLGPIFFSFIKKKLPGQYGQENDIDQLIKRQKERLRSQYGLQGDIQSSQQQVIQKKETMSDGPQTLIPREIHKIFKETQWGGGEFLKEIQLEISKNFSYTMADSKVNAFILLCEKRKYLRFLTTDNQSSTLALKNFLVTMLLLLLLVDEVKERQFYILDKIAKKLAISSTELALAVQLKILMTIAHQKNLKDNRVFSEILIINQFSEETIKEAVEIIAQKEANLWAKNSSQLFEELTLALNYASVLSPIPKIKNKKDISTACEILGITIDQNTEEIKKAYKKIALVKHPDKILSQKLPKALEQKAIENFNSIQEAYEVIIALKK
ncbi:MAG: DnaJ domain-containing protein [Bacteriovorax sp.]|nr:DnaJ domain-containing protein [Bacteriovorax sp.]